MGQVLHGSLPQKSFVSADGVGAGARQPERGQPNILIMAWWLDADNAFQQGDRPIFVTAVTPSLFNDLGNPRHPQSHLAEYRGGVAEMEALETLSRSGDIDAQFWGRSVDMGNILSLNL